MTNSRKMHRREFLFRSGLAAGATCVAPLALPSRAFGNSQRPSPANRITIGIIVTGRHGDPFKWDFIHLSQVAILKHHVKACATANSDVAKLAAPKLAETGMLSQKDVLKRLEESIR